MPKPAPQPEDDFDATEPESVEFLLSDHLKDQDDISIQANLSTDSIKPKSKITDYHFDSGIIPGSAVSGTPIPNSEIPSDGPPMSPGFAGRPSSGDPTTDNEDENSEASQDEIPSIEGYVILRELGRGGMGVVYKAKQMKLERIVALKMILHHGYLTKETLTRFRTEADALARVAHPGIVQVYEISEHNGQAYFTLEYCGGGSLAREIKKGPFAPHKAAEVIEQLARAIHFAHEANIIHRDLKPGNVLRTTLGQYKITDFGLAKKLDVEENITQSGAIIGTPGYMAPEQASGDVNRLGPACDIYALGVILYECVTGRVPFRAQNVMDAVIQVVTLEPVAPSRLEPKTPKDLETIILKCLHKTPERRYKTAADLAEDLGRFLRGEPILGRPASFTERSWKWIRKHPAVTGALAMSIVGLFAILGLTVWKNRELTILVDDAVKREQLANEELQAKRALDQKRDDAQVALAEARAAEREGKWDLLGVTASRVVAAVESQPELAQELEEAQVLLARAENAIRLEQRLQAAKQIYDDFSDVRDRVRFSASPFNNLDLKSRRELVLRECREGLAKYDLDLDAEPKLVMSDTYNLAQQSEIREGCYELYLLAADAVATPQAGDEPTQKITRAREATALLQRAAVLRPDDTSWVGRAVHYARQAKDEIGADLLRANAGKRAPQSAFDFFLLGENHLLLGQSAEAKLAFNEALRKKPNHFWAQFYLGYIAFERQPPAYTETKTHMNFCITQKKNFAILYSTRGLANAGLREFDHAEEDFAEALQLDPPTNARYTILLNRAGVRQVQKKWDAAVEDLNAALAIVPDQGRPLAMLAEIEAARGQPAAALTAINRAIQAQPNEATHLALRAQLVLSAGDRTAALNDLARAIELSPLSSTRAADYRLTLAQWLFESERYDQTIARCDEVLKLNALSNERRVNALTTKAKALGETRRYEEVLTTLEQASQLGWKPTANALRYRGLSYARLGKLAEAIADLSEAIEKEPSAQLYADRGWVYVRSGAIKLGQADFDHSLEKFRSAEALSGRGFARVWLGEVPTGVADAAEAVRMAGASSRVLYNCARCYAVAANRMATQEKGRVVGARQIESRVEYQNRATDLLEQTLEQIPAPQRAAFWKEIVKDDTIRSLGKLPAFVRLEQRFAATSNQP